MGRVGFVFVLVMLISCSKEKGDDALPPGERYPGFTTYTIPKGEHYATNNSYKPFRDRAVHFQAIFDSSAIYTTISGSNQSDINKLFGVSDGNTHHQLNSARFGWDWNGQAIEIHAYCYADGTRSSRLIGTAEIGKIYEYSLMADSGTYRFNFDSREVRMTRTVRDSVFNGYTLYPYFGGDEPAPHEVKVYLKELNQ